jgi:hypothetical protein
MGAPNQVFKFDNFLDRLIGGIKANTISAIGTINPGSLCTQYLYAPQIHFNLASKPIAFIGNLSNKMGEFSLIWINVTSIRLFHHIKEKATMDDSLNRCVFFLGDPSIITHVSYTQFATHVTFYFNNFCISQGKKLSIYATVIFST